MKRSWFKKIDHIGDDAIPHDVIPMYEELLGIPIEHTKGRTNGAAICYMGEVAELFQSRCRTTADCQYLSKHRGGMHHGVEVENIDAILASTRVRAFG